MEPIKVADIAPLVLDLVAQKVPVKDWCYNIRHEHDTDDPDEHVVFKGLNEPAQGMKMTETEKRSYDALPDGGQTLLRAILRRYLLVKLKPEKFDSRLQDDDEEEVVEE